MRDLRIRLFFFLKIHTEQFKAMSCLSRGDNMFRKPYTVIIIVLIGLITICSAGMATVGKVDPKKEKPHKNLCCNVGISYKTGPGKVMLQKICNKGRYSVFYMRSYSLTSTCTNPGGTVLKDQSGKRYAMIAYRGIANCRSRNYSVNHKQGYFQWTFERLNPGVRAIDLVEMEDEITSGMTFWAWRKVSLRHCKF